jgi:hypothetical protein
MRGHDAETIRLPRDPHADFEDPMFYRLRDRYARLGFARTCTGILQTSPVVVDASSNVLVLSQLQHKDVLLFLLALKSFARQVPFGRVAVLDDGTLTPEDTTLLGRHVPGLTLLRLHDYRSKACPSGGTWERMLAIASFVGAWYVVQLDSDTLTVSEIDEVQACVQQGRSFALGTWNSQEIESMHERCMTARRLSVTNVTHVQVVAEAHFDRLRNFESLRYIRGCSGFAGFARGSFSRDFVEGISTEMRAAIGKRWEEWGSEQVLSNIVVANAPDAVVLPHPKFADCGKMKAGETAFIHFIGTCRFRNGTYARMGAQVIDRL